ncbi:MAG: Clp protease ClpP [Bacteroidales bacterium]|nr:Clp protease ClpP [Bacteroidales bacterium]
MNLHNSSFINIINSTETDAEIEIFGYIGEDWWNDDKENTFENISKKIKSIKAGNITVKINSLGGEVDQALSIYDLLRDAQAKIKVVINGFCASAATVIAMAGDTVSMSQNALFLIHQCSTWASGNEKMLSGAIETLKTIDARLLKIYTDKTGKTEDEIKQLMAANNGTGKWITAQQAKEMNFIDEIYNEKSVAVAVVTASMFNESHLPKLPKGYENNIATETDSGLIQTIKNLFQEIFNLNNNQSRKEMKKFPFIVALLALTGDALDKKDVSFTDEQLSAIETALGELNTLKAEHENLKNDHVKATNTIQTLTQERDALQAKVSDIPAPKTNVNGADTQANENTFDAYIDSDPFYQSIQNSI